MAASADGYRAARLEGGICKRATAMGLDDPGELIRATVALHAEGRLGEAETAYRSLLRSRPDDPRIWHNLGVLRAEAGDPSDALACFDRALVLEPGYATAHFNRANALFALRRTHEARDAYMRVVALDPDSYEAHRRLGFLWQAAGRRGRALDHFARTLELRRGEDRAGARRRATRGKLAHDAAQLRHIAENSRQPFERLARAYDSVAETLGDGAVDLDARQLDALFGTYNTPHHMVDAPETSGPAVDPGIDEEGVAAAFARRGAAWFDGLLTPPALARLRKHLLESTIWFDFAHIDGFLAAYLEDGLASPLLLQIADEVRAAFPAIVGDHPLSQAWAFKGLAPDLPIELHSDDAEVSLNFWLTPDSANRNPGRAGMIIHPDRRKSGCKQEIRDKNGIVVPYRQNRAVLFKSPLRHGSDAPKFAAGYENLRINVTMLFGGM